MLILACLGLLVHLTLAARRVGLLSASGLLIYVQFVMLIGTIPLLDPAVGADAVYGELLIWTFLTLVFVTAIGATSWPTRTPDTPPIVVRHEVSRGIWLGVVLCILVSVLYYWAVGYLTLFEGLRSIAQGSDEDIAGLRLESYSGSRYLFPGYVNRLKNALLPSLVVVIATLYFADRRAGRWLITIVLSVVAVLFLTGTGQRGALITFAIVLVVYIYYLNRQKSMRRIVSVALILMPLLFLTTLALGRSSDSVARAPDAVSRSLVVANELVERVLGSNQWSAVVAFRYVHDQPVQWGQEWFAGIVGLLPGVEGSDLDNRIYGLLYGSTRGTAPPSVWGSAYHNWGFFGTVLFAAILAMVALKVSRAALNWRSISTTGLIGYAGTSTIIGTWAAGGLTYLFNAGLIIFILLWRWGLRSPPPSRADSADSKDGSPIKESASREIS